MATIETSIGTLHIELDGTTHALVQTNRDTTETSDTLVKLFGVLCRGYVRFEYYDGGYRPCQDVYGRDYHSVYLCRIESPGSHKDASEAARKKFKAVATVALNTWARSNPEALDIAARAKFEREMEKLEESIAEHQSAILELGAEMDRLTKEEGERVNRG